MGDIEELVVADEGNGWSFYPLIANHELRAVLGVNDQGSAVGQNVTIVLCEPGGNGHWSMVGWDAGVEIGNAVKWCRDEFDDSALFESLLGDAEALTATQPVSMRNGLQESDPAAPIIDYTQDPELLDSLVAFGAAGSSGLSSGLLLAFDSECNNGPVTNLDATMSSIAVVARESVGPVIAPEIEQLIQNMGLSTINASAASCLPCFPWSFKFYGPWSPWSCTGGPAISGVRCEYTGCTRSRTVTRVSRAVNCTTTVVAAPPQTQGPQTKYRVPNQDGSCPASP